MAGVHHLPPLTVPHNAPLRAIQRQFHALIRERAGDLVDAYAVPLPFLARAPREDEPWAWFAVPGMYGGFRYRLVAEGEAPVLIAESWSRVVQGSGQRHEVTPAGYRLVDEGFV